MIFRRLGNYKLFLISNSLLAFILGIFTPFYILFLQDFGGNAEQFGLAVGLMMLAGALTSYFVGKYSDVFGRKRFIVAGGLLETAVIFTYTLITTLPQLYILQAINGVTISMQTTMETTFLGDITKKEKRGLDIGRYQAILGVIGALAMMGSGFLVGTLGIKILFYAVAAVVLISTVPLFYIKED